MSSLNDVQRTSLTRLQREFETAKSTHGPLRCLLIHQEGEDMRLPLSLPGYLKIPEAALMQGMAYSYKLIGWGNDNQIDCENPTSGSCFEPTLDGPIMRCDEFALCDIYLFCDPKEENPFSNFMKHIELDAQTRQQQTELNNASFSVFNRLAKQAGQCFDPSDCDSIPGVSHESLETIEADRRWLWILFDLAWQKIKGTPLQAERWIWKNDEKSNRFLGAWQWECNTKSYWSNALKEAKKRKEEYSHFQSWAKRPPQYFYSTLDDLFTASVQAIDLMLMGNITMTVKKTKSKPRHRPVVFDPAKDAKIVEEWEASKSTVKKPTMAEFEKKHKLKPGELTKIIDRHRKRNRRNAPE